MRTTRYVDDTTVLAEAMSTIQSEPASSIAVLNSP